MSSSLTNNYTTEERFHEWKAPDAKGDIQTIRESLGHAILRQDGSTLAILSTAQEAKAALSKLNADDGTKPKHIHFDLRKLGARVKGVPFDPKEHVLYEPKQ